MLTLCTLLLAAAPATDTPDAKIAAARRTLEQTIAKDAVACETKHREPEAQTACADQVADAAIATYVATLRAGGAPLREALAKERKALTHQQFLLALSEAAVAPELVAASVRSEPDEATVHAERVHLLVSTAGIEPFEKELRAINLAWLWGDLERVADAAADPVSAAAFFERVAANTFLPDDVRMLARVLAEHRRAKLPLRVGVGQALRLCREGKRPLALVKPSSACKPTTDARQRCVEVVRTLRGPALPTGPGRVELSRDVTAPSLGCLQVMRDGALTGGVEALTPAEESVLERAFPR